MNSGRSGQQTTSRRRRVWFIVTFFLATFMQIRVRAEVLTLATDEDVIDLPLGCYEAHQLPCALKTHKDRKFRVRLGRQEIILGSDSSCSLSSAGGSKENARAQLLRGEFLVFTESEMEIKVPAGNLRLDAGTLVVLDYSGERTLMRPIQGEVQVKPLVAADAFSVLPGQENWLGRVRTDHHVAAGLPLTTNLRNLIAEWSRLSFLEKSEFMEQARVYHDVWDLQRDQTAELLKNTVQENIASHESRVRARRVAAESARREQLELRKMLWENTFGLPEAEMNQKKGRVPASSSLD